MTAEAIVTGRLLQFAGILVLFGSSVFYVYGFAAGELERFSGRHYWPKLILPSAALTGIAGVLMWVMAQTASVSDQPIDAFNPAIVWGIATETRFGRICLLRLALLACCLLVLAGSRFSRRQWICVAALGGCVGASLAWTGHGVRDEGVAGIIHLGGDLLHLFSAGIWLGALVPLSALLVQSIRSNESADAGASYDALESFSAIGIMVVLVLLLSGIVNSWFLVGFNPAALLTTIYGLALSVKIVLFGFDAASGRAHNRYRLTPSPRTPREERRRKRPSICPFRGPFGGGGPPSWCPPPLALGPSQLRERAPPRAPPKEENRERQTTKTHTNSPHPSLPSAPKNKPPVKPAPRHPPHRPAENRNAGDKPQPPLPHSFAALAPDAVKTLSKFSLPSARNFGYI